MSASAINILSDDAEALPSTHLTIRAGGLWQRWFGNNPSPTQPAYLAAAKTGDPDALAQLYADYQEVVWRLCRRLLKSEADAEDALQNTFVKAFAALPRFRGEASIKTWLFRIAVNESTTLLRRRERCGSEDDITPSDERSCTDDTAERMAIRELLVEMKPEYQMVLTLRYWEELSYEEIAEVLEVSLPNVKMRLHRAKEEFRKRYVSDSETGKWKR